MRDSSNNIIDEVLQGLELARQLQMNLSVPYSCKETRNQLIQKIISTFEKALQMVKWKRESLGEPSSQHLAIRVSESPPLSDSEGYIDLKDHDHIVSRKRETLTIWTKTIRVKPGMGVEEPLEDGHSWRKYVQKDILEAVYPRGYYKCTHRNIQGCLATKKEQRSDEDPTVLEITYRGKHTCTMTTNIVTPSAPNENQESNLNTNPQNQNNSLLSLEQQPNPNEQVLNLRAGLKVQRDNLNSSPHDQSFPSTSNIKTENQIIPLSPMLENCSSPSYISPATSGISHFAVSPSLASSGFQINDMISAANSPTVGLEFPFDQFEFDGHNFTLDNLPFFF
ncbi:hypothetical protein TanjilG_18248 [Lupinus angustifolius]|uniref:WRKY domain-containing protein n=1 Tax=Lupinus angustifolius TaxID=3871 RepID=A0A1J7H4X9_LUPAN|nr:PREDICTED: probable WRKY transcription factor 30 [Lupinus angustifolius]OIV96788.1 hypothetical protein TanjilG_18248 [Lupinus angustifolius]